MKQASELNIQLLDLLDPLDAFLVGFIKPKEHFQKETLHGHSTKFKIALYEVHVKPLFENSLYENSKKIVNYISYIVYRIAHFEQSRYAAIIFNLMLSVLFGYRMVAGDFSWANLVLEAVLLAISIKILLIGDKK